MRERELTPKQLTAARLIGSGQTQRAAAEAVGVSENTMSAWVNDTTGLGHAMAVAIAAACDDALAVLMAKATGALTRAVEDVNPDTATKAADVIFRRRAQVEKYEHGRAQLELQREALAAKAADESKEPVGLVGLPPEEAQP